MPEYPGKHWISELMEAKAMGVYKKMEIEIEDLKRINRELLLELHSLRDTVNGLKHQKEMLEAQLEQSYE